MNGVFGKCTDSSGLTCKFRSGRMKANAGVASYHGSSVCCNASFSSTRAVSQIGVTDGGVGRWSGTASGVGSLRAFIKNRWLSPMRSISIADTSTACSSFARRSASAEGIRSGVARRRFNHATTGY